MHIYICVHIYSTSSDPNGFARAEEISRIAKKMRTETNMKTGER